MITVKYLKNANCQIEAPIKGSVGAAGYDIKYIGPRITIPQIFAIVMNSDNKPLKINTGLCLEIPYGWEAQVRSRSSLANKGIWVAGGVMTIDSDYRGPLWICLCNFNRNSWAKIEAGDRIAQLVFSRVYDVDFVESSELTPTQRGAGGFGSTGK